MEVRAEIVRLELAETFVISRESQDWADVVHVEPHSRRRRRTGRGGADRPIRRDGGVRAGLRRAARPARRTTIRSRSRRSGAASQRSPASRPRRRRSTRPSTTCRASCSACRSTASSGFRATGRRRRGRSGSAIRTTWRAARRARAPRFQQAEAQARRRRRARRRARAGRSARDRPPAPGGRQRVVDGRRGARRMRASSRHSGSSTSSSRCGEGDAGRRRAPAPLAAPDLRRRGLPHARRRRRDARRSPTGSTSSSRSRAGSARRSGWPTRRVRSGSA